MPYALISLILVQLGFIGASAFLYTRMRSKADADKAAMIPWGIKIEGAIGTADSAKRQVEMIELEHYKNLRALFESQALQIGELKGEIAVLRKELAQADIKIQTLQRMDRKARKEIAEEAASALPGPEEVPMNGMPYGDAPHAQSKRRFGAIP